jgi:aryl sulfotransferase
MNPSWPDKTRELQNHHMDSTRWDHFQYRDGDIVIGTWAKSGTTWLQQIVGQLIFEGAAGIPILALSPWLEYRALPLDKVLAMLAAQTHRRVIKTHLPADAIVHSPNARYIYIGRDGRDALWSWYEHHHAYTDFIYGVLNDSAGRIGPPFPRPGNDVVAYYHRWLDEDGYPAWPFFSNIASWWEVREQANVLLLHFDALKADLAGEMRWIAAFLDIPIVVDRWPALLENCTFVYMRAHADEFADRLQKVFVNGGKSLVNKGVNARWRETLSGADSAKYEALAARELSAPCAHWLAGGD